jgi:hypothetical protein
MGFNFEIGGPIDYVVYCYEQIPKENWNTRESFLTLFLEKSFRDVTGRNIISGNRQYHGTGKEDVERMLKSVVEELEPVFYDVCENLLGFNSNRGDYS